MVFCLDKRGHIKSKKQKAKSKTAYRKHPITVCGLGLGIALVSTYSCLSFSMNGEIRDTRVYISPVLCARVSPTNRYANVRVGSIMCSLT